ncbi:MAG: FAD-binding oxidoreductase [Deltaproteobacteria bacterium]|nr:MAG: FAD-binding oxidoreductase [Deltaproteobacteria bacterium]
MIKKELIREMESIVGKGNVLHTRTALLVYEYDASLDRGLPDAVAFATSTEQVVKLVKLANREGIAFLARGSGTNLSGGTVPTRGGIVIELSRMNRILEIDLKNQRAVVEPGVYNLTLQNALAPYGYYYAPDPASQKVSTLGGNVGENAGGPLCLKYGVTTNHVLGLEVVLPDGEVVQMGGKALDHPGYDLVGIMVGSEGTLGIVTKITVRIMRKPEAVKTFLAIYDSVDDAGQTVSDMIADGIIPATLEMMDKLVMKAVEESVHAGYPLDAEAVLIIELDGLANGMDRLAQRVVEICKKNHVREVKVAASAAERDDLWAGRKGAFGATGRLAPSYLVNDGTVPRTQLPRVLRKVAEIGEKYGVAIGNVFHAGDGNLHPLILFDERDPEQLERVRKASYEILKACVDVGGTISGEHGIGIEKLKAMGFLFNQADLNAMWKVKRAFDPKNLCNPGKVLPEIDAEGGVAHA